MGLEFWNRPTTAEPFKGSEDVYTGLGLVNKFCFGAFSAVVLKLGAPIMHVFLRGDVDKVLFLGIGDCWTILGEKNFAGLLYYGYNVCFFYGELYE